MLEWGYSVLRQSQQVKYAFIQANQQDFSITSMCKILNIRPSSYYDWLNRDISEQQIHRNHCELLVRAAHSETKQRYGYERLHAHLTNQGYDISKYMVRRIKQEHGIECKRHKRFKVTTDSNHDKLVYPNLLEQKFDASRPNQAWVSDITYIWTAEGWLYLAGIKDLYTKELVSYALNKCMTKDLVCHALNMAIRNKKPSKGLIVHSDRGSQYCSHAYSHIIAKHGFKGSMSRKGNPLQAQPSVLRFGQVSTGLLLFLAHSTMPLLKLLG